MRSIKTACPELVPIDPMAWLPFAHLLVAGQVTHFLVPDSAAKCVAQALFGVARCYKAAQVDALSTTGELPLAAPGWSAATVRRCADTIIEACGDVKSVGSDGNVEFATQVRCTRGCIDDC